MSSAKQQATQRDNDVQGALIALLGALIVMLLIVANVQLANVGNQDGAGDQSSTVGAAAIPPPVQGTSNDVLAEELRGLSGDLTAPLNLLRGRLDPLSSLPAGQFAVADSFQDVAGSVRKLGSVRKELSALSSGIDDVVGNTEALNGVGQDINSTGRMTNGMARTMRRVEQSIAATGKSANESITQMSSGIEAMKQSLAATSGETKGMAGSLEELNSNMTEFLALFCLLLTSESSCNAKEAARLSPSIIDSER